MELGRILSSGMRGALARYALAPVTVAISVGVRAALSGVAPRCGPWLLLPAILATAGLAGFGPGLIATLISVAAANSYMTSAGIAGTGGTESTAWGLAIFALEGLVVCLAAAWSHNQRQRLRISNEHIQDASNLRSRLLDGLNSPAVFLLDDMGRVTLWSAAAASLFGRAEQDVLGRSAHELCPEEDQARGSPQEDLERARRLGQVAIEGWMVRGDGVRFLARSDVRALPDGGFVVAVRDITAAHRMAEERRAAEERLRVIVNSAMDAIIAFQGDPVPGEPPLRITLYNRAAEHLLRCRADDALGVSFDRFVPERFRALFHHQVERLDREGATSRVLTPGGVFTLCTAEGREFPAEATLSRAIIAGQRVFTLIVRDVSERVRHEEKLRVSEERLKSVITSAMDAIVAVDGEGMRISLFNPAAELMFRCHARAALGHPLERFIPERHRAVFRAVIGRVVDSPSSSLALGLQRTLTALRSDGEEFPMEATLARAEVGGRVVLTFVIRDISERRRAEERLRQSEERFRVAQDLSPDGFCILAAVRDSSGSITDFRVEYANPSAARILRRPSTQLLGRRLLDLVPSARGQTRLFNDLAAVVATVTPLESELHITQEGFEGWIRVMAVRLNDGVAVSFSDITQRKHAETELREAERRAGILAEGSAVLASSLDYEATIKSIARVAVPHVADWCLVETVNDEGERELLAVAHADESRAAHLREILARQHQKKDANFGPVSVLRTGRPEVLSRVNDELLAAYAADPEVLENLRALKIRSIMILPLVARGRTLGVMSLVTATPGRHYELSDLPFATELARRAALAADNARLYREAQNVNRMKDEFLATLSHELRTPLTAILGWVRMLQGGKLTEANMQRGLEVIERNTRAQSKLVEDLLDVSRIITGKLQLNVRPVELLPAVEAAIDAIRPAAEARGVRLHAALVQLDGPVWGDPDRIQQIVWNLLSNAVKFTPPEGRVDIRLERSDGQARITITDTGKGFKPEFKPHIFQRFRQADSTTTRAFGGLGLGLAIVRHLVELHGGSVSADSEGEGKGATFSVILPLMRATDYREPLERRPALLNAPSAGLQSALAGVHVLVVEDESDAREMIGMVLQQCGARVTLAGSAREAIEKVTHNHPDVLISDIGMPEEDGYTLISKLRKMESGGVAHVPAAALTAFARQDDCERALAAGFETHVSKPVEPQRLATVVAELAGRTQPTPQPTPLPAPR